jgi:uncharacterized membrane protein YesL
MEDLLLVFDELDDVYAMVGLVWRSVASFLMAVAAFVGTGFLFLKVPVILTFVAAAFLSLGLIDAVRDRRQAHQPK